MENSLIPRDSDDISVFNRPGGTLAKVVTVVASIGALYGIYLLAPVLVSIFQNLFYASAFCLGLVGLWALVTSKDFQRNFKLGFSMLMWKITGWFVKMDPIHILKRGIEKMKAKKKLVAEKIDKIQGILTGMNRTLENTKKDFTKEKSRLEQFTARGMSQEIALSKNKITRYATQIKNQSSRIEQTEKYLKVLKELERMVRFKVEDTENQVQVMTEEYEAAKAQAEAVSSIKSVMNGFGDSREEMMAADEVWKTVNNSIGEIDRFLDGSNDLLINFGADVAAGASKADELLKEFESHGFQALEKMGTKGSLTASKEPEKEKVLISNNGFNYFN